MVHNLKYASAARHVLAGILRGRGNNATFMVASRTLPPPSVTGFPGVAFTMTMRCVRVGVRRAVRWKDAVYLMKKDSRVCVCVVWFY